MKRHILGLTILGTICAYAGEHAPHMHGTAELHAVLEKGNLIIELRSPLENLVGFEQKPKTEAQRAAVKSMIDRLNKPAALFKLPQVASCAAGDVRIDHQFNDSPLAPSKSTKAGAKMKAEDHADLTASFSFACANPSKLDSIEVLLFRAFSGIKAIRTQIIGPRGQSGGTLTPTKRIIKF